MDLERLGKYELRRVLGKGAMGTVYEGWDPAIERTVAIKTVRLPSSHDPDALEEVARFRREAQAAGRLSHPNIVGVYDTGETGDLAWIVMEYVDGPSLKAAFDKNERMPLPEIGRVMDGLLAGLAYSHGRGVVHRDIKPANVMLTSEGAVKIADFGIARIESSSMTQVGTVLGTPAYMSPEQFRGETVDARSDIYSAGVVLYQLLTGERPFDGSASAIMHKALNTEPPRPSDLAVTSPTTLDSVVAKAMAKRPSDRYASAAEFAEALRRAIAGGGVSQSIAMGPDAFDADATMVSPATRTATQTRAAAPPTPPPPSPTRAGSHDPAAPRGKSSTGVVIGGGVAGLAAIAAAVWFFVIRTPEPAPTPPQPPQATTETPPPTRTADATPQQPTQQTPATPPVTTTPPATPQATSEPSSPPPQQTPVTPPTTTTPPATPQATSEPSSPPPQQTPATPPVTTTPPVTPRASSEPSSPPPQQTPTTPPATSTPVTPRASVEPTSPPPQQTPATPPATTTPSTPRASSEPSSPPQQQTPVTPPATTTPPTPRATSEPSSPPPQPPTATTPPQPPAPSVVLPPLTPLPAQPPQQATPIQPPQPPPVQTPPAPPPPQVQAPPPQPPAPTVQSPPPQTQPPPQVAAAGPTAGQIREALSTRLAGLGCTLATGEMEGERARVAAITRSGMSENMLRAAVSASAPGRADLRVRAFAADYCPAIDAVRGDADRFGVRASGLTVALRGGGERLLDHDAVRPVVTMPDFPAYLTLLYLTRDEQGQVWVGHLHPNRLDPGKRFAPRQRLDLDPKEDSGPTRGTPIAVGEPFGTDMMLAIATEQPLFPGFRSQVEPLAELMPDLNAALATARQRGSRVAVNGFVLETAPRP